MCHSGGGCSHIGGGKKSWKCISEVDASLAFERYGDKNIFVPLEVEVDDGGRGWLRACVRVWMKGGCEIFPRSSTCSRSVCTFVPWRGCKQRRHFEEGARCEM